MTDTRSELKKFMLDEQQLLVRLLLTQGLATSRYEYSGTLKVVYEGYAFPGSDEADAVWLIMKYEYNVDDKVISKKFANNDLDEDDIIYEFNKVWDDRATYEYI